MVDAVLDSSAVLALIRRESGAERVATYLPLAAISAVNFAEVIAKLMEFSLSEDEATREAFRVQLDVVDFDEALAVRTGVLRATTRSRGLSLGDRACLALATRLGLPAVTADRAWADLDLGVEVVLIR